MQGLMMDYQLTLPTVLRRAENLYGHKEIVSCLPDKSIHRYNYREMARRAKKLAVALKQLGVQQGGRVATLSWNHYQHMEAYYAVPCIGSVIHPLNLRFSPEDLGYIVNHAEDKIIIVAGSRSAVGKAKRGGFRFTRPDTLAAEVLKHLVASVPNVDKEQIEDVIVGNATPEAEQGLNVGRLISLMALDTDKVPGMTVNRYCSSGLETIAIASAKIHSGLADCIVAGGVESMTMVPIGGYHNIPNPRVALEHPDYYWGMGLTAEAVAREFNISRSEQDEFAYHSHQKALSALATGKFKAQIAPIKVSENYTDENGNEAKFELMMDTDEGPRADTSPEALANLQPVFDPQGSVTAGNSSQMSDGAAFVMVVSERFVKANNLKPIAKLVNYALVGVPPRIMGIGPLYAIPEVLKRAGMKQDDIELVELNEAFASQAVAVIKGLNLNPEIVNVNGGAIALGHPMGCTGTKLSIQLFDELRLRKQKYGMVTMCVGTGQGAAGVFELLG